MDLQPGKRIELLELPGNPDPIPAGSRGTVRSVERIGTKRDGWWQINVAWDDGCELMLNSPPDRYRVLDTEGHVCKP